MNYKYIITQFDRFVLINIFSRRRPALTTINTAVYNKKYFTRRGVQSMGFYLKPLICAIGLAYYSVRKEYSVIERYHK